MEKEKLTSLVHAAQRGEDDAATNLYNAFYEDLYYHIYKTVNDAVLAEDLLQDTFLEIFQSLDQLNEPTAFVTWSKQIAYHKCTAYFKKRRDLLADEQEDGFSVFDAIEEDRSEFIPDEALEIDDFKQTIHAMIDALPPEQRSALLMRYFDEISVKEIAEIQGVSEGTVKSRLNYGRKAIKESVEDYEKKNNVKLHCTAIVPLLLWLFRKSAVTNGAAAATRTTSATCAAVNTVAPVAAEGSKTGIKAASKLVIKKLIAGVVAAAVAAGGIAASVLLQKEPPAAEEPIPMFWYGYGTKDHSDAVRRFELTVEQMDDVSISGHLEVAYLYEITHTSNFTGTGTVTGDTVYYQILLDEPVVLGTIPKYECFELRLEYDKQADIFTFQDKYAVGMSRISLDPPDILAENKKWSGYGENSLYNILYKYGHLFELDISQMTEEDIQGVLTISHDGEVNHLSKFVGRGYLADNCYCYEINLETPRVWNGGTTITISSLWLVYDINTDTFSVMGSHYSADLSKE